jgi:leucyl/phenylalanyl-tRNA--protein transferase
MLSPALDALLRAYAQGVFPMAGDDGRLRWYDPDPRAIIPLDAGFHVPRRLARKKRAGAYELGLNRDFPAVIKACAAPAPGRPRTWLSPALIALYTDLHRAGYAHSVEIWQDGVLVGGLYGVALGGLFAGESMFSRVSDASKLALVHLVERLRARGFVLLDTQFLTPHLAAFGAREIPRAEYKRRLRHALSLPVKFV